MLNSSNPKNSYPFSDRLYSIEGFLLAIFYCVIRRFAMLAKLTAKDRSRIIAQLLESFKTDELSLETIDAEVEAVRAELYAKQKDSINHVVSS
jgi:hypothetical protein